MKAWQRYLLLSLLLVLPLLGMIARQYHVLTAGNEVVLKLVPVDPRSLFRGDYVTLNYEISSLDTGDLGGDDQFEQYGPVYVGLRWNPDSGFHQPTAVYASRPPVTAEPLVLRGEISYLQREAWNSESEQHEPVPLRLRVRYGIESYFVPEGSGRELERRARSEELAVLAAVVESGRSAIRGLRIDGESHYIPLFWQ